MNNIIYVLYAEFLGPPAEMQLSFSSASRNAAELADLSVVSPSVRLRGGGLSQKRFSNVSSFVDMELLWGDINHIL